MKISLKWIKQYIDIDASIDEISAKLTMAGIEVEGIEYIKPVFSSVVVARIVSIVKHPNADKLCVCRVSDGEIEYQVVCGAKNIKENDIVPLAKLGAKISDFEIKKTKLRGVTSEGMLCSEKELSIGFDDKGIMILPQDLSLGSMLESVFELEDTVLELGITPNRGDCLSARGIARELAQAFDQKINYNEIKESGEKQTDFIINIEEAEMCTAYGGAILENVRIQKSPFDLRYKLFLSNIRAINNIVDITNYILLDIGQPMHAFDLDKLHSRKINIRFAKDKESIVTLDDEARTLSNTDLIIADDAGPIAVAGVMGGALTAVSAETKSVFFEAASFSSSTVRKTSRILNLSSESSYRFERGTDANAILDSLHKACQMTKSLASANIINSAINVKKNQFPKKKIPLRIDKVNSLLGISISGKELDLLLKKIEIEAQGNDYLVPTYRNDIEREVDLIEEVARVYGYDLINQNTEKVSINFTKDDKHYLFRRQIANQVAQLGLHQVINYSFVNQKDVIHFEGVSKELKHPYQLANPLNEEQSFMRGTLIPGLVRNFVTSYKYKLSDIKLFEIGAVFPEEYLKEDEFAQQVDHLGIVLGGKKSAGFIGETARDYDYFDMKGIVESFFDCLNLDFELIPSTCTNTDYMSLIKIDNNTVGVLGKLSKVFAKNYSCKENLFFAEIDLERLLDLLNKQILKYKPIDRMPSVDEDMSFVIDENVSHNDIISVIKNKNIPVLEKVDIFDIFKGKNIPTGKKSVAYSFTYRGKNETLKLQEVNAIHEAIKQELIKELNVEFR